ncbi:MAG: hypothetical protein AB1348_09730 [Nitrospirota bacterium]
MAKLTFILINPENIAFMRKVAEFNNGKVEQGILTISVTAPKLVIKREWAEEIFGWRDVDANLKWKLLMLNHSDRILKFSRFSSKLKKLHHCVFQVYVYKIKPCT